MNAAEARTLTRGVGFEEFRAKLDSHIGVAARAGKTSITFFGDPRLSKLAEIDLWRSLESDGFKVTHKHQDSYPGEPCQGNDYTEISW